mmetsp:Transcript_1115/g.2396  ORF Transcript_1115/g.2396 Transcript_1115/m.2396 type:complete len:727 (+) Transcript_1115:325-2505(+)|eukprot:g7789.t1
MSYLFASEGYASCFGGLPEADGALLRKNTAAYMKNFNPQGWHDDPITTVLNGVPLKAGQTVDTVDAFNRSNGKQVLASSFEVDLVIGHIWNVCGGSSSSAKSTNDIRAAVRAMDAEFCDAAGLAPSIIGNQALDFQKQDGITEIEESIQANLVEQRLNDLFLQAERAGEVVIRRDQPVFVGCVSNFSNFLDLFRKVLRHIELSVPVVVLSRSNTTQHMFRWFQLLQALFKKYGIDRSHGYLLTYLSCSIDEQRRVFAACQQCPMHFTGSRTVAGLIKTALPKLFASTGGPNTLVATKWTDPVADAVRMSNLIENKGQCTALRHVVCPGVGTVELDGCYAKAPVCENALESIEKGEFAAILKCAVKNGGGIASYSKLAAQPLINVRIQPELPVQISEQWRELFVDVTSPDAAALSDQSFLKQLAAWLNREQPISLAVNADSFDLALELFKRTGMVVYTVGNLTTKPALTAQARPQDGEVFGEFPPRRSLTELTQAPMVVPSPVAAYNAVYADAFLLKKGRESPLKGVCKEAVQLWGMIEDPRVKGYAAAILEYLVDACATPGKKGYGARTTLFGLQRPPIDFDESIAGAPPSSDNFTLLRTEAVGGNFDRLLLFLLPFVATTAYNQVQVSFPNEGSEELPGKVGQAIRGSTFRAEIRESRTKFVQKCGSNHAFFNVVQVEDKAEFMLAQQFVSRLFPLGHIKSTKPHDVEFLEAFGKSPKWLRMRGC